MVSRPLNVNMEVSFDYGVSSVYSFFMLIDENELSKSVLLILVLVFFFRSSHFSACGVKCFFITRFLKCHYPFSIFSSIGI